jgi:O-antigen ligase
VSTTTLPDTGRTPSDTAPAAARGDALAILVGLTVCLLPFLSPAGPGNTAPADLAMGASIAVALLWATRERLQIKVPYLVGVTGLVLGGAFAALMAGAPVAVGLVLAQDVLLLLWAATLALGRHSPAIVAAATHAWCRTAPIYSAVVVVAYVIGFTPLSGVTAADGVRASYTFGDPNLAGNYLVISLFMMAACERPRSPAVRRIGYLFVLLAIGFTGSNGAMLTLAVGSVLCAAVVEYRRHGTLAGILALSAAALVGLMLVVFVMPQVNMGAVRERAASSVPLLRDSFGRSANSTSERAIIVDEGVQVFLSGNAVGVGPARTKSTLAADQAPYVKEAHNDYLATLLERGLIGALGLLALGVAIATRCVRLLVATVPGAFRDAVPRAYLLVVTAPVMATAAGFYEVLHFRHLWTWLGIVAALTLAISDEERKRR